jgi:hypothetical protein
MELVGKFRIKQGRLTKVVGLGCGAGHLLAHFSMRHAASCRRQLGRS